MEEQARRFGLEIIFKRLLRWMFMEKKSESKRPEMSILGNLDHLSGAEYEN